jgi:hypothetical protein
MNDQAFPFSAYDVFFNLGNVVGHIVDLPQGPIIHVPG